MHGLPGSSSPGTSSSERLTAARTGAGAGVAPATPGQERLAFLVSAVAAGEHAAMAEFYDATQRFVLTLVSRLVRDRSIAEEVTLDVYLQVWRRAASYTSARGKVLAWLLTIARSRALDRNRSERARVAETDVTEETRLAAPCACDPTLEPERAERCELVAKALALLPEVQRRAVELAYFGGLSHTEIAARLGEPLGTVKTRVRLGLLKLRELLRPLEQTS
ncbi:MAG: sigma-70 family RNA polymerase sigma factor [Planctomycetes bacterium]|nr:sigma-70 family RNA polymerase sigma factor [Planctomycetota bacterium]